MNDPRDSSTTLVVPMGTDGDHGGLAHHKCSKVRPRTRTMRRGDEVLPAVGATQSRTLFRVEPGKG